MIFYNLLIHYDCHEFIRIRTTNCIPSKYMCDGVKDCEDGSDEIECSCFEDEFQCSYRVEYGLVQLNLYQCISINSRKDGKVDCLSTADENR